MAEYRLLGVGEPESFRCRVYDSPAESADYRRQKAFLAAVAEGWVETEDPSRTRAVRALEERGLAESRFEPASAHGLGRGRVKVWTLTEKGKRLAREHGAA